MAKHSIIFNETPEESQVFLIRNAHLDDRQKRIIRASHCVYVNGYTRSHTRMIACHRLQSLLAGAWQKHLVLRSDFKEDILFATKVDDLLTRFDVVRVWLTGELLTKEEVKKRQAERRLAEKTGRLSPERRERALALREMIRDYYAKMAGSAADTNSAGEENDDE